ncbi:DUF2314 domain-containing protein [Pseudoalteromonas sp. Z9A5]|uniref:DUF2314 domain-containing protein n=1 Tax=Pseudoalteromonas sp. Z9A5 TaxID=2686355 RepID=UPI00140B0F24|nr:DUF2314 domain-containing protein [Pseudoalteromonas sp. Z9A5]
MTDKQVLFFSNDSEMENVSRAARDTFKYFWRELAWESRRIVPGLDLSIVKVAFKTDKGDGVPPFEHMWIGDIDFDGINVTGTLMNEPNWASNVSAGDVVNIPVSDIGDWMYVIDNKVYGGHTVNLMRLRMSEQERNQHDNAWGLDFGNPSEIELTPSGENKPQEVMINTESGAPSKILEHPMSVNMASKIEETLQTNSSVATSVDENGWTMLHRESLAGNYIAVSLLLKYGADSELRNSNGHSAIELANMMGWHEIANLLKSKTKQ